MTSETTSRVVYATAPTFTLALQIAQRNQARHAFAVPSRHVPNIRTNHPWAVLADPISEQVEA